MSTVLLQRMSSTDDDDERTYSKFYAVPFWPFAAHHSGPHSDIIPFSRFIIIATITILFFFFLSLLFVTARAWYAYTKSAAVRRRDPFKCARQPLRFSDMTTAAMITIIWYYYYCRCTRVNVLQIMCQLYCCIRALDYNSDGV